MMNTAVNEINKILCHYRPYNPQRGGDNKK